MQENRYLAAQTVTDVWICYPWEATYTMEGSYSRRNENTDIE